MQLDLGCLAAEFACGVVEAGVTKYGQHGCGNARLGKPNSQGLFTLCCLFKYRFTCFHFYLKGKERVYENPFANSPNA